MSVIYMIDIRPVSDLRNKFTEIEASVREGNPIFLTKNGYGTMVVLSIERYSELINNVEAKLDEAVEDMMIICSNNGGVLS